MGAAETIRGFASRNATVTRMAVTVYGRTRGFDVRTDGGRLAVTHRNTSRRILLNAAHAVYARDVIDDFDSYFDAVEPTFSEPMPTVDYSAPRSHRVRGWDTMPIEFPSLAEPLVTATQYLDFAGLEPGQTALDLGAYSGFTSILFQEAVGPSGHVVAVEADPVNLLSVRKNLGNFRDKTGLEPLLAEVAIWSHSNGLEFTSEGNMGSAVASLMKRGKDQVRQVPSSTLSDLARRFDLGDVAFIKADIEGAELEAFSDRDFFQERHPKIIFEGVVAKDREPGVVIALLEGHGYRCRVRDQIGSRTPLVECV